MSRYDEWRTNEIKKVGLETQLGAEALLDRQAAEPMVMVNDDRAGKRSTYRRNIADRFKARGQCSAVKIHSIPSSAYGMGWERIFGHG